MPLLPSTPADPAAIKQLILTARPQEWALDFPTAIDIDELFQDPAMVQTSRLWRTATGEPAAYAFVHFPFNNLTFEALEPHWTDALEDEVIAWAWEVTRAHYGLNLSENTLDASCRAEDARAIRFLTRHGFERQEVESLSYVVEIPSRPSPVQLPPGYFLRPLQPHEVEQALALHQAAFGTDNFSLADRLAVMNTDAYIPDLDLVVVAPDGTLAGGCICSIGNASMRGGEPVGFTDPVYVHPGHQGKGIARALLVAGLIGLYARGVRSAHLGTSSANLAMQRAAEAAGFICVARRLWFSLNLTT